MTHANDNSAQCDNEFYVYTWTRPDTNEVFYVGKGKGNRSRQMNRRNRHFLNIVAKLSSMGMSPVLSHVADGMSESESFKLEVLLISQYGRVKDGGSLCNMTDGGDGASGVVKTEETIRKVSASVRAALSNPEVRKKISQRGLKRFEDPSVRAAHGAMITERYKDPVEREKISVALRGKPKSQEHVESVAVALKASWLGNVERRTNHQMLMLKMGPRANNKSGYKGVSFDKSTGKWLAQIEVDKRNKHLGRYEDPAAAARAYDDGAVQYYGTDVYLNFPAPSVANDNTPSGIETAA